MIQQNETGHSADDNSGDGGEQPPARRVANGEWPSEMVITIDFPTNILTLLYIRQAWALKTQTRLPALTLAPHIGASYLPETATAQEWAKRWDREWQAAWHWYRIEQHRQKLNQITSETFRNIVESGYQMNPLVAPLWTFEYGDEGFDRDAYNAWSSPFRADPMRPFDEQPERVNLPEVKEAWRKGLDTVVVLPYEGYFAGRITRRHLVVSSETRKDKDLYARALSEDLIEA